MLKIPSNVYGHEIGLWLNTNSIDAQDKYIADIIKKISFYNLANFEELQLSNNELSLLTSIDWKQTDNLYLKACCFEVLRKKQKGKLEYSKISSDAYLDLFKYSLQINRINPQYLMRSICVRDIKQFNDEKYLKQIFECLKYVSIGWVKKFVDGLLKSYTTTQLHEIIPVVNGKKEEAISLNNYHEERDCISLLAELHNIDKETYQLQMALSYESEINYLRSDNSDNIIYVQLPELAKSAFKHIYKVKNKYKNEYDRIFRLMKNLSLEHCKYITMIGEKVSYDSLINKKQKDTIKEYVAGISVTCIEDVFSYLQHIPFPSKGVVEDMMHTHREIAPLSSMLSVNSINNEGRTIGKKDAEESLRTIVHKELRVGTFFLLGQLYYKISQSDVNLDVESIFDYLQTYRLDFINNDTRFLLAKGIAYGFSNDFVASAHILTPTLECILRKYTEARCGSLAKWEQSIQEEALLFRILLTMKEQLLFDSEIIFELHCFLESGIDTNFRNNLMHGLMPVSHIVNEGIYLWWLCIKILSEISCSEAK